MNMYKCLAIGSSTISRCGLVRGGVALVEKACHCTGRALRSLLYAWAMPSVVHSLSLLPVDQDVANSGLSPVPCRPACCHASYHTTMDYTSETICQSQLSVVFYKSCHVYGVSSQP